MNTTTKLTPATVAEVERALLAKAHEEWNGTYGFKIYEVTNNGLPAILIFDYHFGSTNEVAGELALAGFAVELNSKDATLVYGKVAR